MPLPYLDATPADITARLAAVASAAAGGPVEVHVGAEHEGFRNVGVDFPRGRRSAAETSAMRRRVVYALERARVVMAPHALAPKVPGNLRGVVQVGAGTASRGDCAGLIPPRRE